MPHATAAVSTTCASTIPYTLRRKAWRSRTSTAGGRSPTWKKWEFDRCTVRGLTTALTSSSFADSSRLSGGASFTATAVLSFFAAPVAPSSSSGIWR